MSITSRVAIILISISSYMPYAYAGNIILEYYHLAPPKDSWPDSYYILYGVVIAATVLFIMSVMKKPDEIF